MTARGLSLRYLQTLRPMIRAARERGLTNEEILAGSRVDPDQLGNPHATLRRSQELIIYRNIKEGCERPDIGLMAGYGQHPQATGPLGYAQSTCATVGELVAIGRAYRQLGLNLFRWDFQLSDTEVIHRFSDTEELGDLKIFLMENVLALFLRITRDLVIRSAAPTLLTLDYPDPGYAAAYREMFGPVVRFGQPVTELRFPKSYMDIPLANPDPLVKGRMEQLCQALVSRLNSHLILADEIKSMLREFEFQTPSVDEIAGRLHTSPRSLHRHLRKQNTSFRALADEVNQERAIHYLTNTDTPIQEVSDRCGFVELRSFYAAFRRWTGMSPANFRRAKFNY